jgi:F-type H+-transporting ATPase subunit a
MPAEGPKPLLEPLLAYVPAVLKPWVDIGVLYAALCIAFLCVLAWVVTRRLEKDAGQASKLQMAVEWAYESFAGFIVEVMGPEGKEFIPLLATFFFFILTMNLMGLIPGVEAPTSRLSMTGALAVIAFVFVQYCGFRKHGPKYLMHFLGEKLEPAILWYLMMPLMLIVHVVGELARPLSLALRLFGNIFGDDTSAMQFLLLGRW